MCLATHYLTAAMSWSEIVFIETTPLPQNVSQVTWDDDRRVVYLINTTSCLDIEIYVYTTYLEFYINLQAPCVLYIGQAFRYSPENAFYTFNQQIYFIF